MDADMLKEMESKLKELHGKLGKDMTALGREIRQEIPQDKDALDVK